MVGETVVNQRHWEEDSKPMPHVSPLKRLSYFAARGQENGWANVPFLMLEGFAISAFIVTIIRILGIFFQWTLDLPTIWFNVILYVSLFVFFQSLYTYQVRGTMEYCFHLASYPYAAEKKAKLKEKSGLSRIDDPVWFLKARLNAVKRMIDRSTSNHFQDMLALALRRESPEYADVDFNLIRSTIIMKLVRETLPLDDEHCWGPFETNERRFIQQFQDRKTQPNEFIDYLLTCYRNVSDDVRSYAKDGTIKMERGVSYRRDKWFEIMVAIMTVVASILSLMR